MGLDCAEHVCSLRVACRASGRGIGRLRGGGLRCPVLGPSFAFVHFSEFLGVVFEGFSVQEEFSSPDEPLVGLFPVHRLEMCRV